MSRQNKQPTDLMPLAYIAFWLGFFGWLTVVALMGGK